MKEGNYECCHEPFVRRREHHCWVPMRVGCRGLTLALENAWDGADSWCDHGQTFSNSRWLPGTFCVQATLLSPPPPLKWGTMVQGKDCGFAVITILPVRKMGFKEVKPCVHIHPVVWSALRVTIPGLLLLANKLWWLLQGNCYLSNENVITQVIQGARMVTSEVLTKQSVLS